VWRCSHPRRTAALGEGLVLIGVNLAVRCADDLRHRLGELRGARWVRDGHALHFKSAPQREAGAFGILPGQVAENSVELQSERRLRNRFVRVAEDRAQFADRSQRVGAGRCRDGPCDAVECVGGQAGHFGEALAISQHDVLLMQKLLAVFRKVERNADRSGASASDDASAKRKLHSGAHAGEGFLKFLRRHRQAKHVLGNERQNGRNGVLGRYFYGDVISGCHGIDSFKVWRWRRLLRARQFLRPRRLCEAR
jgi:hypothetical protein